MGLRRSGRVGVDLGDLEAELPDQYGGIATEGSASGPAAAPPGETSLISTVGLRLGEAEGVHRLRVFRRGRTPPISTLGLRPVPGLESSDDLVCRRNLPDQYGGMRPRGLTSDFESGDLGRNLICMVGLRQRVRGVWGGQGIGGGTALICTVGLRLAVAEYGELDTADDRLGTALICTVELRREGTDPNFGSHDLVLGTALICTVGLRLLSERRDFLVEVVLGAATLICAVGLRLPLDQCVVLRAVRALELP